ncbi:MAG: sugar ABC transporter permease [Spirochaetales bacterium]|nr:sugar ABC transporter permease [Spirochaetales bacterium]
MTTIKANPERNWAILFIIPWLLHTLCFLAYPLFLALKNSFLHLNIISPHKAAFVGFGNWILAIQDVNFWKSLFNILLNQAIFIPCSLFVGLLFALLIFELGNKGVFYRIVFFIPVVTSVPVAYIIFRDFASTQGPIQQLLVAIGILSQPVDWAFTRFLPMPIIALFNSWKWFGIQMLILLGGVYGISKSSIEASCVDGANWYRKMMSIIIPQLKPQIVFILTVNIINGLQMFTEVFIVFGSEGGIYGAGLTPVLYLYDIGFAKNNMGYASSIGLLLAIVIFSLTSLQLKLTNKDS